MSFRFFRFILLAQSLSCFFHYAPSLSSAQPVGRGIFGKKPKPKPFNRRIVAVGDVHGDLDNFKKALRFSDVINEADKWTGKIDFLVQTGDVIDRGDDYKTLFKFIEDLRQDAQNCGGTVITLLGNHEWMNASGYWNYVTPEDIKNFGSEKNRMNAILKGDIGNAWKDHYKSASRLPLHGLLGPPDTQKPDMHYYHPSMELYYQLKPSDSSPGNSPSLSHLDSFSMAAVSFVHGGLAPYPTGHSYTASFPGTINRISDSLLHKMLARDSLEHEYSFVKGEDEEEFEFYRSGDIEYSDGMKDSSSPIWYRGWFYGKVDNLCEKADEVLVATGTRIMVMGHTHNREALKPEMTTRCDGKVIIIATGISEAENDRPSALSIDYTMKPVEADPEAAADANKSRKSSRFSRHKTAEQKWEEEEVVKALYGKEESEQVVISSRKRTIFGDCLMDKVKPAK